VEYEAKLAVINEIKEQKKNQEEAEEAYKELKR